MEYAGAIYHVMNRGDRQEAIFDDDSDREYFSETRWKVCPKTGWQVHADCQMGNHFHLVPEHLHLTVGLLRFRNCLYASATRSTLPIMPRGSFSIRRILLTTCACNLGGLASFAGEAPSGVEQGDTLTEFRHQDWTSEDGLPSNLIHAIVQTRDGYLWLAASDGLARFDGVEFTVFNRVNSPEMVNHECWSLAEEANGNLWIGTADGLLRWQDNAFTRFTAREGLLDAQIYALCAGRDASLWVGSNRGVNRLQAGSWTQYAESEKQPMGTVASLYEDPSGKVWSCGSGGIHRFESQRNTFERIESPKTHPGWVHAICLDAEGQLWSVFSGNTKGDACLHRQTNGQWSDCGDYPAWKVSHKTFLFPDRGGNLWFPMSDLGLYRYGNGKLTQFSIPSAPPAHGPVCMNEDREGNLWVSVNGLHQFQPLKIRTYSVPDGLAHDNVWTFCEKRDGAFWIGTDGGLSRFENGRFPPPAGIDVQPKEIRSLAEDAMGTLWFGTRLASIGCLRGGRVVQFPLPGDPTGHEVRSLVFSKDGSLWLGTGHGLHVFRDGQVLATYTETSGLRTNDVRAVLYDNQETLWLGTNGGGLSYLPLSTNFPTSPVTTSVRALSPENYASIPTERFRHIGTQDGLSNDFVTALFLDSQNILWVGTGRGLNRLDLARLLKPAPIASKPEIPIARGRAKQSSNSSLPMIFAFTKKEGLIDDSIRQILEDDFGRLWISCDRGIYHISRQELNAVAEGIEKSVNPVGYDEFDGLLSSSANGLTSEPAGCKTSDGRLWFATTKGAVVIDPSQLPDSQIPPAVVIEHIVANGRILYDNGDPDRAGSGVYAGPETAPKEPNQRERGESGARQAPENGSGPMDLPPSRAYALEFHYTANSFIAPEKIRFQVKLDGYESEWHEAGTRRLAHYTILSPGAYRFRVRACNHHNVWSETGSAFSFSVTPFFYQTWWFRCGLGTVLLSTVYTIYRKRVASVRQAKDMEQRLALAMERQRIARDIHDDIGARLTQIALLGEIAETYRIPATAAPKAGANLADLARDLAGSLDAAIWAIQPDNDNPEAVAGYLGDYAQQILSKAGIDLDLGFPEKISVGTLSSAIRHNLFLAVKEGLNNIIKHSNATRVRMTIELSSSSFELVIADNGHGFDIEAPAPRDRGNGLENMRQRVEACGGRFEITSAPGQGTTIRILIHQPLS